MKEKIKKFLQPIVIFIYKIMVKILPLKKCIVFESNIGRNYTGNPRYIYEELVKQGLDKKYKCYYIFDNKKTKIPGKGKVIKRMRFRYFYVMATAKIWVSDSRFPKFIIKKKGNKYIQTWHGTPLKKLALDMNDVSMAGETTIEQYKKHFYDNTRTWDYLISQNNFSTNIFKRCFAFDKNILEIGYPRNDILINNNNKKYINELKKKFSLPLDKKIILYAPTWRDDEFYDKGKYKFTHKLDYDMARQRLSDKYIFIVKYHYLIMDNIDWTPYKGFIYDFDMTCDISELYLVSDILITDYSSVMFDFSLLKRPMFFFAYDLEKYKNELRGFYFDFLEEVPGAVTTTTEDLINAIENYNKEDYKEKYDKFIKKYNHCDNGKAAKKVVKLIEKII